MAIDRSFTPIHFLPGQRFPDFLPLAIHELPVLLVTPNRSGLRVNRFGSAYLLLRLSALECLNSLASGMTYYALC